MKVYAEIPGVNWSALKLIHTSPRLFKLRQEKPREDKKHLRLGRLIHCALLEPERFESEYVAEPDFGDMRTNTAKAKRAQWLAELSGHEVAPRPYFDKRRKAGKNAAAEWEAMVAEANARVVIGDEPAESIVPEVTVMTAAEYEVVRRCVESVREHETAREWLRGGRGEEVLTWTDEETGVACKARLDFIAPVRVTDVKSTSVQTEREMQAQVARYGYHGQIAFYHDGAVATRRIPALGYKPPALIFVQTVEPFDVVPFFLEGMELSAGRGFYRSLLRRYQECESTGWWPGIAPGPIPLELPRWAPDGEHHEDEGF